LRHHRIQPLAANPVPEPHHPRVSADIPCHWHHQQQALIAYD
jgi:hypothetical protein